MIIQEQISENLVKTYSDQHVYIHGGYPEADYEEAIDPIALGRTYVETDKPIVYEEITDTEALNIIMGRRMMPYDPDGSIDVPDEH